VFAAARAAAASRRMICLRESTSASEMILSTRGAAGTWGWGGRRGRVEWEGSQRQDSIVSGT
jgi:hypothetical protein